MMPVVKYVRLVHSELHAYLYMASKAKRRKLLPDLDQLESQTKAVNKAVADFKSACEAMTPLSLVDDIKPRLLESMTE